MLEPEAVQEFALVRDFAIIMTVAGLAVVVFRRLNQPPILGYLLAGILVGPFTLPHPPVTNTESIRLLADLGLVLLLFALGLEFGWRRIRQVGFGVLLIGTVEMLVMVSLGYEVGQLLGWSTLESLFLGSALAISSSAILVKVLRDTGRLASSAGRLIVGILVMEDFAAVIMLALLSGVASTGAAGLADVGALVGKLTIFAVASLALGAVFVPRIIEVVSRFHSSETMLLTSLALCFALALLGQLLGISAAAGAFLIGAVVGDTEQSEHVSRIIVPIRDMFGALFFVSIGMLINVHVIKDYLVPALVVSAVFMVGKVVTNAAGTLVTGQPGRVPLQVGLGMPQIGEFSLAMVKVGVEQNAIGAFMYQVIAAVTAINSLVYPYIVRSTDRVGDFIETRSPALLRRYMSHLSEGLHWFRTGLKFDSEFSRRIRGPLITLGINLMIVAVVFATGTFTIDFASELASPLRLPEGLIASAIGLATLALCFPSAVAIWRSLHTVADETTAHLLLRRRASHMWAQERLRAVITDSAVIFLMFLLSLWSLPFVSKLLGMGYLGTAPAIIMLAILVFLTIKALRRMHGYLEATFSRTFLGSYEQDGHGAASGDSADSRQGQPAQGVWAEEAAMQPASGASDQQEGRGARVRRISRGEAELVALAAAKADQSAYQDRLGHEEIVWEVKEVTETRGYYRVVLTFHAAGARDGNAGEAQVYVDHSGAVRFQQTTRWPSGGRHRGFTLLYISLFVALTSGVIASLRSLFRSR